MVQEKNRGVEDNSKLKIQQSQGVLFCSNACVSEEFWVVVRKTEACNYPRVDSRSAWNNQAYAWCSAWLAREERLSILHVYFSIHQEALKVMPNGQREGAVRANEKTAWITGRGVGTVSLTVKQFTDFQMSNAEGGTLSQNAVKQHSLRDSRCMKHTRLSHEPGVLYGRRHVFQIKILSNFFGHPLREALP